MKNVVGRARILKISIILAVLVIGATAGGVYIYMAATNGGKTTAEAEQGDPESVPKGDESADAAESTGENGGDEAADEEESAIPVRLASAEVGTISTYISATANLVPENEVRVLAEAEGRVTALLVEEGDRVRAGQLLAELLRDEAEILVNTAQLTAENARMAYERAARMHADKLIAQEEFDKITMDHRIAQQELAEAEWRLEKTQIRAPFDGRVTLRNCTLGQHIRPGDELFTVTDFDPLVARLYLPEKDVLALDEGREVRITLAADDKVRFRGRILRISPVVDTATGTVKVTVAAIAPPRRVRPGGFVTVDITRETHANALLLPKEAVIRELKKAHVFVADGSVASKRAVTLGLEEREMVEILTGIDRGEQIVVAGQGGLDDGATIKVLADETDSQASTLDAEADQPAQG
jgi:membrane fusion protein (multidrug efflux system)